MKRETIGVKEKTGNVVMERFAIARHRYNICAKRPLDSEPLGFFSAKRNKLNKVGGSRPAEVFKVSGKPKKKSWRTDGNK